MIRSELDVLLDKVQDVSLRTALQAQIDRLRQRRSFGLVFEQHIPERVRLPQRSIRAGSQVVSRDDDDSPTWEVVAIEDGVASLVAIRDGGGAYLPRTEHGEAERLQAPVESLVVISDFGEPVLPGLHFLGSIDRGGDKPYHLVINGENHHALEALRFTHAGKVDCIYIDPPYNSGARDWKYNNDYVDENDGYRHSKWLAFMERRLKLAKELLNPDDSVLIVTIDEREYLRLGLLLEQTFPAAHQTMVSSSINVRGVQRKGSFGREAEYLYFVQLGRSVPSALELEGDWNPVRNTSRNDLLWIALARTASNSRREDRPNLFYPIFIRSTADGPVFDRVGEPFYGTDRSAVDAPEGAAAVWPLRRDGTEGNWQVKPGALRELIHGGFVRLGRWRAGDTTVYYLKSGERKKVTDGLFRVVGHRPDGSVVTDNADYRARFVPTDIWRISSHDAGVNGSNLNSQLLGGRRFPFPKSLYAVEDALRFFVGQKPNAVVLDYFAGSGTTAHAVARLNRQDRGRRQAIVVTNNEVSAEEAVELRMRDLRPGDSEWEHLGIFEHITRPRVEAAITGLTPNGTPIDGDYKFTDEFPMAEGFEENVAFLELRYLDADDVDLGLSFDDLAPLLWLRAGATGPIAGRLADDGTPLPFVWTDSYGVLFEEDRWRRFVDARPASARTGFLMTHSPTAFAGIAAELPTDMSVVRIPDSYLSMFLADRGRA